MKNLCLILVTSLTVSLFGNSQNIDRSMKPTPVTTDNTVELITDSEKLASIKESFFTFDDERMRKVGIPGAILYLAVIADTIGSDLNISQSKNLATMSGEITKFFNYELTTERENLLVMTNNLIVIAEKAVREELNTKNIDEQLQFLLVFAAKEGHSVDEEDLLDSLLSIALESY